LPRSDATPRPAERRVVVTGWGLVTPLGGDVERTWAAAVAGRSGTREITRFDARGLTCRVAGEVDDATAALEPLDRLAVQRLGIPWVAQQRA